MSLVVVLTLSTPSSLRTAPRFEPSVWITHSSSSLRITTLPIFLTPLIWSFLTLSASSLSSLMVGLGGSNLSMLLSISTFLKVFSTLAIISSYSRCFSRIFSSSSSASTDMSAYWMLKFLRTSLRVLLLILLAFFLTNSSSYFLSPSKYMLIVGVDIFFLASTISMSLGRPSVTLSSVTPA